MSTSLLDLTKDVRANMRTRLAAVSGLPAAAQWQLEGLTFTPTLGTAWLRESLTPIDTAPRTIGRGRRVEATYLYRVGIFTPSAKAGATGAGAASPTKTLDALADAVVAAFEPGVTFATPAARTVRVTHVRRGGLVTEPDWTQAPVLITCTADAITAS